MEWKWHITATTSGANRKQGRKKKFNTEPNIHCKEMWKIGRKDEWLAIVEKVMEKKALYLVRQRSEHTMPAVEYTLDVHISVSKCKKTSSVAIFFSFHNCTGEIWKEIFYSVSTSSIMCVQFISVWRILS